MKTKITMLASLLCLFSLTAQADSQFSITMEEYNGQHPIEVPPGNLNSSYKWYSDKKYVNAVTLVTRADNICNIKRAGEIYDLDPVAIMASIVGEHTFNMSVVDWAQEKALNFMLSRWENRFSGNGLDLENILNEPAFRRCETSTDSSYHLWECYEKIWELDKRNG